MSIILLNAQLDKDRVTVGTEATMGVGSDRYPYIVVGVERKGRVIWLEELEAEPAAGYDYFSNQVYTYSRTKSKPHVVKAVWRPKRRKYYSSGSPIGLGYAEKYSNPCF